MFSSALIKRMVVPLTILVAMANKVVCTDGNGLTMFRSIDKIAMQDFTEGVLIHTPQKGSDKYLLTVRVPSGHDMLITDGVYDSINSTYAADIRSFIPEALPTFAIISLNHTDALIHADTYDNSLVAVSIDNMHILPRDSEMISFEIRLGALMIMSTINGTVRHGTLPPSNFRHGQLTFDLEASDYNKNAMMWNSTLETMLPVGKEDYILAKFHGHNFEFAESSLHYMTNIGQVANNYIHNMQTLAGEHDERIVRAQGLLVPFPCGFTIPICCPLSLICPICPTIVVGLPALFCCIV